MNHFKPNSADLLKNIKPTLLEKFVKINRRNIAVYGIVSAHPPIFYVPRITSNFAEFTDSFRVLFDFLKDRTAYFLCVPYYTITLENAHAISELEAEYYRLYPKFKFIHLCNNKDQQDLLQSFGLKAFFCNQNALVDEKIYQPMSGAEKKYEAVYDAQFVKWKRHYLAAKLSNLALIYYSVPTENEPNYLEQTIKDFRRAHFFNHNSAGEYKILTAAQVNQALNECRVGLCLSEWEGAMYASIQYLLAGLPVVTTSSLGGRDVFFDDEITITVEPTPEAVKRGVTEMIARNLDADYIRKKTLARVKTHRDNFISLIQDIYHRENINKDFSKEWDKIFFNKLVKNQKHIETIEWLKTAGY